MGDAEHSCAYRKVHRRAFVVLQPTATIGSRRRKWQLGAYVVCHESGASEFEPLFVVSAEFEIHLVNMLMKTFTPRPSRVRTPGLRPRCTVIRARDGARCDKPQHDAKQSHRWSTRQTTQPPRKKFALRKAATEIIDDPRYRKAPARPSK